MNLQLPATATPEDAERWLRELVRDFGLGFHLETRPEDYVFPDSRPCFSVEECRVLSDSLDRLFAILGDTRPHDVAAREAHRILIRSGRRP